MLYNLILVADVPFQDGLVVGNWFVGNVVYTVRYFFLVQSCNHHKPLVYLKSVSILLAGRYYSLPESCSRVRFLELGK